LQSMICRICSGGTSGRARRRWPGCPPRFLPEAGVGGGRLTEGGSEEGGFDELVEFLPIRSSRSAIRRSKDWTSTDTAACASGESVSQIDRGSGGCSFMLPFYCHHALEATMGLERLQAGSRFVERMLTVVATCRQQDVNVLDFLTRCYQARLDGQPVPSLLPAAANSQAA